MLWVAGAAFLYYIYEVGFFTWLFGRALSILSLFESLGQTRFLQIPPADRYPGPFTNITIILKTLFLSLIPTWHPQPYSEPDQDQNPVVEVAAAAQALDDE